MIIYYKVICGCMKNMPTKTHTYKFLKKTQLFLKYKH